MSNLVGSVIARKYRIDKKIGEGGMGTIYQAHHLTLETTVAVKVLHEHLIAKPDLAKRFHREAKAVSQLHHEHIIQVLDFGKTEDGIFFMVMEFIKGQPLDQIIVDAGRLGELAIIKLAIQICDALDEAHAKGVVHRDLKPENIMVQKRRTNPMFVKVVDFGIAKLLDPETGAQRGTKLTMDGLVCGTPEYISPEQATVKPLDGRSDLYSLGVMMYELVSNNLPFIAGSPLEIATMHVMMKPKSLSEYDDVSIMPELEELILQLMHKDPAKRPQEAHEVATRLRQMQVAIEAKLLAERTDTAVMARHITPTNSTALSPPGHQLPTMRTAAKTSIVRLTPTRLMKADENKSRATGISMDSLNQIHSYKRVIGIMSAAAVAMVIALITLWPSSDTNDKNNAQAAPQAKTLSTTNNAPELSTETVVEKPQPAVSAAAITKMVNRDVRVQDEESHQSRRSLHTEIPIYAKPEPAAQSEPVKRTSFYTLLKQAEQAKANGNWKRVARLLKRALKQRRSTKLYKQIGRAYMKSGNTKNACRYFRKYINAHPRGVKRESATDRIASYLGQCG